MVRRWGSWLVAFVLGAVAVLMVSRGLVPSAKAQYLGKFQNVDFGFSTTGGTSTLTFFDRDTGVVYLYVASGRGDFQLARRLTLSELGQPLAVGMRAPATRVPSLPSGLDAGTE
ncbi:hypothetical protein FJZ36_16245 [Candidatus Poribacteria bacterium]|nr:hypothetical protein [Candidatus Poribacteria bacterium]